jgi:hypothetical protein
VKEILSKVKLAEDVADALSIENPAPSILKYWIAAMAILKTVDIKCTVQDFRYYMLFSLAIRAENERLRKQLANDFNNIILLNK